MNTREKSLWKWLENGKPGGAMLRRIEDSLDDSFPDVIGKFGQCAFLTELKVATLNKKTMMVKMEHLTTGQILFASNWSGGSFRCWFLIQVDDRRFLVGGHYAKRLTPAIKGQLPLSELEALAVTDPRAVAFQIISRMAGQ